jgi:hypothetical protein
VRDQGIGMSDVGKQEMRCMLHAVSCAVPHFAFLSDSAM